MNPIDWNLERAAKEAWYANTIDSVTDALQPAAWIRKNGIRFNAEAEPQDDSETALYSQTAIDTLRAQLAEAQARVAELTEQVQKMGLQLHRHKLDAARYRWLRSAEGRGFPGIVVYEPDTGEMHVVTGVDADAAIDAAMRAGCVR